MLSDTASWSAELSDSAAEDEQEAEGNQSGTSTSKAVSGAAGKGGVKTVGAREKSGARQSNLPVAEYGGLADLDDLDDGDAMEEDGPKSGTAALAAHSACGQSDTLDLRLPMKRASEAAMAATTASIATSGDGQSAAQLVGPHVVASHAKRVRFAEAEESEARRSGTVTSEPPVTRTGYTTYNLDGAGKQESLRVAPALRCMCAWRTDRQCVV